MQSCIVQCCSTAVLAAVEVAGNNSFYIKKKGRGGGKWGDVLTF